MSSLNANFNDNLTLTVITCTMFYDFFSLILFIDVYDYEFSGFKKKIFLYLYI